MLSFFPREFLDEIWDLSESVSEGFPTYSSIQDVPLILHQKVWYIKITEVPVKREVLN